MLSFSGRTQSDGDKDGSSFNSNNNGDPNKASEDNNDEEESSSSSPARRRNNQNLKTAGGRSILRNKHHYYTHRSDSMGGGGSSYNHSSAGGSGKDDDEEEEEEDAVANAAFVSSGGGGGGTKDHHQHHHHKSASKKKEKNIVIDSLTYVTDESEAWRAHLTTNHLEHRGRFWNEEKHEFFMRYILLATVGIVQATVAYLVNLTSSYFIDMKFEHVNHLLEEKHWIFAYLNFLFIQTFFALVASMFVWIEPVSAGSGIPEVKCFLNGIDLPRVVDPKTLVCKVLGVIGSVSAGLPVGKEGPMVHSGAVVATAVSSGQTRNDKEKRDMVACGAAAGVCTAFSSPIGGVLFSLEEGASYWYPSLTWRTYFCSMIALTALYCLNTIGSTFGKVGFNKLFSFGNFVYEGQTSSFAVAELPMFLFIGMMGGLIGATFNNANEELTHWRQANVNNSKQRRLLEVLCVSSLVTTVSFCLPFLWNKCTPLPDMSNDADMNNPEYHFSAEQLDLLKQLVPFMCEPGKEYNEVASLMFTEPGVAIRQLFHLHHHAFTNGALTIFFVAYISLAVVTYGIAVPSGLFVPSLLSGAAFGRLFGNLARKLFPSLARSNIYALIGAAAVLGGMARMTISLTVILLECTGNEQYVLPLMVTLMTTRIVGSLFNDDLYHIHIHMKKGVKFLESECKGISRHHDLVAGQVMGQNVIFMRPVERVGIVYDILRTCNHTNFCVVDTDDGGVLAGTIGRNALCVLLKKRAFGHPVVQQNTTATIMADLSKSRRQLLQTHLGGGGVICNYLQIPREQHHHQQGRETEDDDEDEDDNFEYNNEDEDEDDEKFLPLIQWQDMEKSYPKYPSIGDIRLSRLDRECYMDLRPYYNKAAISVQEEASVQRAYDMYRSMGLRFLPVVNRHNKVVGTITRSDLTPEALADTMLKKGKKHI